MLDHFLAALNPTSPTNRLSSIKKLVALHQRSQETAAQFMSRIRSFGILLAGVTITDLLPLFALSAMDHPTLRRTMGSSQTSYG